MRVWIKGTNPELVHERFPDDQIVDWIPIHAGYTYDLYAEGCGITKHVNGKFLVWMSSTPSDDEYDTLLEAMDAFSKNSY